MTADRHSKAPGSLYFANAAAGLMLPEVVDAVTNHLRREAEIGGPAAATEAGETLAQGYHAAARLIGAEVEEVAFVESGNRALAALIQSAALEPGDHVLVDRTCWGGTLNMLSSYPDIVIDVMPVDRYGLADVDGARGSAHPATKLVILTWCPATCAILNPAVETGALAAELGAFYIVDACQVLGQQPVDVTALRCHGLAASGRKWLRGPRGTALLYASRDYLATTLPFMPTQFGGGRSDARRYETGEAYFAGRVGLSLALHHALTIDTDLLATTAQLIRARASAVPGISVIEQGQDLASFVTLNVAGKTADEVGAQLSASGIAVTTPGRGYTPLDMDARGLTHVVRIAPHLFTTPADVDALMRALTASAA